MTLIKVDEARDLFGKLVPFKNRKLVRRWTILLRKDHFYYSLGTYKDCDIRIRGFPSVEPYHCRLSYDSKLGAVTIQNCSSINGTWINGEMASSECTYLKHGDKITLGAPALATSRTFVFETCAPAELEINEKYSVDWYRPIGAGSSGTVWKARKRLSFGPKAVRAVKVLHCEDDDDYREACIVNEVKLCGLLIHPNICTFYEAIREPQSSKTYLVLELVQGGGLDKFVARHHSNNGYRQGLDAPTAKDLTWQICDAVSYMHSLSVVHRDLKPANILVDCSTAMPVVKLTDFGLSKAIVEETPLQTICGTPAYVAPEVMNSGYGEAVDAWSIGAIVVNMLTETTPFAWTSLRGRNLWKNMDRRKVDLQAFEKACVKERGCVDLVKGLLRTDPAERMTVIDCLAHPWLLSH